MGALARFLAVEFACLRSGEGWHCHAEAPLFSDRLAKRYGFRPAVDLLLVGPEGQRILVEFEISRADPVANQVKFLIAHRAGELQHGDTLVGMFSPAITRGRRCIAGVFARQLRGEGVPAFQLSLLPHLDAPTVKMLNQSSAEQLAREGPPLQQELDRLLSVLEPRGQGKHRVHFAGDVTDVLANLWTWNDEIQNPALAECWGRRRIQYFVHDPLGGEFAPAKFCAFIPSATLAGSASPPSGVMTLATYCGLGEDDSRFDGHRAHKHLVEKLAFTMESACGSQVDVALRRWLERHGARVACLEPPYVLSPPRWFAGQ